MPGQSGERSHAVNDVDKNALRTYSSGEMIAIELRRRLNGATYGDVLVLLGEAGQPLPPAPIEVSEEQIARAREWMVPRDAA